MVETNEQIVREAPDIEAYKLGLLQSAKALSDRGIALPPQLVAQMSGLQTSAINLAQRGIGNYLPYLQEAGYTLGDAQTAIGGVMSGQRGNGNSLPLPRYLQEADYTLGDAQTSLIYKENSGIGGAMSGALPFQAQAAQAMRSGLANVPGQLQAAKQGIQFALASGQISTQQAQAALAQLGAGGQDIASQSVADQLAAYDAIPGVLGAASTGMGAAALAGGDVAAATRQGGQNLIGA